MLNYNMLDIDMHGTIGETLPHSVVVEPQYVKAEYVALTALMDCVGRNVVPVRKIHLPNVDYEEASVGKGWRSMVATGIKWYSMADLQSPEERTEALNQHKSIVEH